jgi:hypothetical protein
MNFATAGIIVALLLANVVATAFFRFASIQSSVGVVTPILAVMAFATRNYVLNQKAYELFVAQELAARARISQQYEAWWGPLHWLVASVIAASLVGFSIRWFRSRDWLNGLAASGFLTFLIVWILLRELYWVRMV